MLTPLWERALTLLFRAVAFLRHHSREFSKPVQGATLVLTHTNFAEHTSETVCKAFVRQEPGKILEVKKHTMLIPPRLSGLT